VLEGWQPSTAESTDLVAFAAGQITVEEYIARASRPIDPGSPRRD
jgi:hypothetical protein